MEIHYYQNRKFITKASNFRRTGIPCRVLRNKFPEHLR